MDVNVLKSYLVSLGFTVDQPQFRKFDDGLRKADRLVQFHTTGIVREMAKWQLGIVGVFGAITGATIGLAEHVADADQKYRLFGLRMMMTQESAKKLKIGLDALGVSMEDVTWDPELHARFMQLIKDQDALQAKLGPSFAANMKGIRDLQFQFARLKVAIQYLGMQFVSSIFAKFGVQLDTVGKKLDDWIQYIEDHLPEMANEIATNVKPILEQFWTMLKAIGGALKEVAVLFQNVVGVLSGDDSIEGTEFSFQKLAKAIGDVVGLLSKFVHWAMVAEKMLLHLANAAVLVAGGHFGDAAKELKAAAGDFTKESAALLGALGGGVLGAAGGGGAGTALGAEIGGAIGTALLPGVGTTIGATAGATIGLGIGTLVGGAGGGAAGAGLGYAAGKARENMMPIDSADLGPARESSAIAQQARELAKRASKELGVPAEVIFSQWAHETGNFKNRGARNLNNLAGITKPGGDSNGYRSFASLDEFERFYVGLLKGSRYQNAGISKAQTTDEFAAALKRGGYFADSLQNYQHGMRAAEQRYFSDSGSGARQAPQVTSNTTIEVGGIHINQPNANPKQIEEAANRVMERAQKRQVQRDLLQIAGAY